MIRDIIPTLYEQTSISNVICSVGKAQEMTYFL